MAITRIKTNQITDLAVTNAKIANTTIEGGKLAANLTYGSNLTVSGNLTVNGTTTTISTTNTVVEDPVVVLAAEQTGPASVDAGILVERGDDTNVTFVWSEANDKWYLTETTDTGSDSSIDVTGTKSALVMGGLTASTGDFSGAVGVDGDFDVGTTKFTVAVASGNVATTGTLDVAGLASLDGGIDVDGAFTVADTSGNVATTGTLDAGGLASLDGGIDVDGAFTVADTSGNVVTTGTLTAGNTSVGTLDASGLASLDGGIDVDGAFTVADTSGNIDTSGTLTVDGATTLNGAVTLGDASGDAITVTGTATFGASADFDGGFTVAAGQTISMGANAITAVADPSNAQDAATKAYVDSQVSAGTAFDIAGDTGTDTVTVGTDTLTFSGTANEITTAVSNNKVTIGLPDDVTITGNLTVMGQTTTVESTVTSVADPIMTFGQNASDDNKDRGIEFKYNDGTAKVGFFGFDDSAGTFTALTSATNTNEVFSGTVAPFVMGGLTASTGDFSGAVGVDGDFDVNTNKFTVAAASGNTVVAGTLDVAGLASLDGGIDVDGAFTVADTSGNVVTTGTLSAGETTLSSATVSDLTSGRVVLAGTSGAIEDSGNLTFDGSTLAVTGAATISTTLGVTGEATFGTHVNMGDSDILKIGAGADLQLQHDGTNSSITNSTGILAIDGTATSSIRVNEAGANVDFIVEGDTNTALLVVDASQDNVGIGGAPNANAALDVNATSAILLARGTTAQRPTGVTGMLRYNTTGNNLEYYAASAWTSLSSDFTVATSQTFSGDNSTVAFTLSALSGADSYTTAGVLVMLNGVVQEPTTVYGVSGTTLTFTTAPSSGDVIEVRKFTTTTTVTALSDADGDTLVQAEESADEDKVRIDAGGSEIAVFDSSGITLTTGSFVGTATQAQYADLAERYASDSYIDAGTVVEFVGEGKVAVCETDGTRSVAGVVSTDPAYLMNSKQEGVNLALAGRVPVKVTGSIQAGDLLVAAGNGRARAEADPKLGTVIGKAIEAHTGDEGVIEVLILMM